MPNLEIRTELENGKAKLIISNTVCLYELEYNLLRPALKAAGFSSIAINLVFGQSETKEEVVKEN